MNHTKLKNEHFTILLVLGAITILLTLYIAFFKKDGIWLETMKVGGPANMSSVIQLYSSQEYKDSQTQAIQQALNYQENGQQDTTQQETDYPSGTIDSIKIKAIKDSGYIKGKKDARIIILEYSELLCPYCKRQEDNQVMSQLIAQYDGKVSNMFRNFIVHPTAKPLALGAECAGSIGGSDKYYEFIHKGFEIADPSEQGVTNIAKAININESKFLKCFQDGKFDQMIDIQGEEGRTLFGISGTPGNVIVDTERGTYTVVAGAYPLEVFQGIIDEILAN